jgi:hypothetical protein
MRTHTITHAINMRFDHCDRKRIFVFLSVGAPVALAAPGWR